MEKELTLNNEPVLLDAEDLLEVGGGCLFSCSNGDCAPGTKKPTQK